MILTSKDISHIAGLARLKLTDEEVRRYRKEIAGILEYVGQLPAKSLKAKVAGQALEKFALRDDLAQPWPEAQRQAALDESPDREKGQVKVKRILG